MRKFIPYCVLLTALLLPTAGRAQLGGFNAKGDFGLLAGSQAPLALIPGRSVEVAVPGRPCATPPKKEHP